MNKKEKISKKISKKTNKDFEIIEKENLEFKDKYQRTLADYQNLIKRQIKEKEKLVKYSNEQLVKDFVPVFDNLKIAMEHVDEENKESKWVRGVGYIIDQFREVLKSNKIEEIEIAENFDPETMEAIDGNGEKVEKEVKSGYTLNGKVIIPAKVILENEKD